MHAAGGRQTQPDPLGVSEVHDLIRGALRDAGLEKLWVTGVVSGLRTGPKFTSWELVDHQADATTVRSMLHVGAFPREYAAITRVLANAGVTLADGLEVSFHGRLEPAAAFGRLRLVAQDVDARVAVGAATLRRQQLLEDLQRTGELTAQRNLAPPAHIRRLGLLSAAAAAGRADVFSVLSRSPTPIDIVEASAAMSGPAAPGEVLQALARLQAATSTPSSSPGAAAPAATWPPGTAPPSPTASPAAASPFSPPSATPPTTPSPIWSPTAPTKPRQRQPGWSWPGPKRSSANSAPSPPTTPTNSSWPPPSTRPTLTGRPTSSNWPGPAGEQHGPPLSPSPPSSSSSYFSSSAPAPSRWLSGGGQIPAAAPRTPVRVRCATVDGSAWTDEDLELLRRSTVMLTPGSPHGVDRATALALLEELQHLRRTVTRLRTIVDEVAQLLTPTT